MDSTIYVDTIINSIIIVFLILFLLIIITNFVDIILDNQLISLNTTEKDTVDDGVTIIDDEEESDSDEVEEQEEGEQEEGEQEEGGQGEEEQGEEEQEEGDEILTGERDEEESIIEDEEESIIEDQELIIDSDEDDMNEINSEMMPLEVAGKSSESLSDEEDRIVGHKVNRFFTHTISNLLKIRLSREKRMRLDKVE